MYPVKGNTRRNAAYINQVRKWYIPEQGVLFTMACCPSKTLCPELDWASCMIRCVKTDAISDSKAVFDGSMQTRCSWLLESLLMFLEIVGVGVVNGCG